MPYEPLDHTGDTGVRIEARSLEELFLDSVKALTDTITDIEALGSSVEENVKMEASDRDQLLHDFLQELLFRFDTERFLTKEGRVTFPTPLSLKAELRGETFDPKRHPKKTEVKAVTYHRLHIERKGSRYTTEIIFDL